MTDSTLPADEPTTNDEPTDSPSDSETTDDDPTGEPPDGETTGGRPVDRTNGTEADPAPDVGGDGEEPTLDDRVEAALRAVRDPEADVTVFEAGLVERVDVDGRDVTVGAAVDGFDDADARRVTAAMARAVRDVPAVENAIVEPVTPTTEGAPGAAGFDTVVAVASAKGGVGKSTVATTLACALAADRDVALFDADVHGPNVPTLLDVDGPIRADGDDHPVPVPVRGPAGTLEVMSVGLMESGAPLAWRGAMAHDAVEDLFGRTAWSNRDTLVVDLPPGTGDVVLTTLQEVPVDGVVVVTTPFPSSVDDTARTVELFRDNDVPVLGAVVNMSGFTCPSCGDHHDLFPGGSVDDLPAPVLAELPFATTLQEVPGPGRVPDAVADLAGTVSDAAGAAWEVDAPDHAVDLRDAPAADRRDRVRHAFTALDPGEPFALVSDRDPGPVVGFLADLAGTSPGAFDVTVERRTPDAWVLTTRRP
jgi:ATP-binding protein involved in chromosome partitioning